jgi:hypothetical protein
MMGKQRYLVTVYHQEWVEAEDEDSAIWKVCCDIARGAIKFEPFVAEKAESVQN